MVDRPSLADPDLAPVWARVRERLERHGLDNRGRLRLPPVGAKARLALEAVTGRRPGATVDLVALERGLRELGLGDDLPAALDRLGHPVSAEPGRRRAERAVARAARDAARTEAAAWPEPWATTWIDEVIRAGGLRGCDAEGAVALVRAVRAIVDHLDSATAAGGDAAPVGRVELAARLFGSAHALDTGTRLEAAATRALAYRLGAG
ncbi:MAG TPA: TIGR02679 domain-containing protein, partial [Acidimicrobiales bacterium]